MLNYVWLGLILLGLAAGLSSDLIDKSENKFQSGQPLKIEFIKNTNEKILDTEIKISSKEFNSFYNQNIKNDFSIPSKITFAENDKEGTIFFKIAKDAPELWKKMAKVNGKEDDLTGKVKILSVDSSIVKANLILEEISFVKVKGITDSALEYAGIAVNISIGLIGVMALWLGIMKIADEAGLIKYIAKALTPITKFLFPEVPSDHHAMGSIIMNISANILGLGNAATPFGLKAMEELNKLNPQKDTATNAMCTFLAINTAGMTLIPATAIAIRAAQGSSQPAIIIGTSLVGSICATLVGITSAKIFEKLSGGSSNFFSFLKEKFKTILITILFVTAVISSIAFGLLNVLGNTFSFINADFFRTLIQFISTLTIPLLITIFVAAGAIKKVKVYESFVEGAKEGFNVAVRIIPYLVAMLVAIGIFRAGGAMDWLIYLLTPVTNLIGMPVESLPMALMRPLSGSGSLGVMAEVMSVHGTDSFIGIFTSTLFGSSETTFYVLAVYFGSVGIKKTRHALACGLLADLARILGALFIVKMLFG